MGSSHSQDSFCCLGSGNEAWWCRKSNLEQFCTCPTLFGHFGEAFVQVPKLLLHMTSEAQVTSRRRTFTLLRCSSGPSLPTGCSLSRRLGVGRPAPLASAPRSSHDRQALAEPTSPCDMGVHTDERWDSQAGVIAAFPFSEPTCPLSTQDGPLIWLAQTVWSFPVVPFSEWQKPGSLRRRKPLPSLHRSACRTHVHVCVRVHRRAPAGVPAPEPQAGLLLASAPPAVPLQGPKRQQKPPAGGSQGRQGADRVLCHLESRHHCSKDRYTSCVRLHVGS